ncbi:replication-associated recombination protein A [Immundisolibacter sp.]|uniref:replication-associated recombination protein A n=1 Tax=Immundisolibacter sp. TaxID=1934948 RepID=UPI002638E1CF|nr:replication-associated recombination protein A [Immundisolibacter sp.]MDD3650861.1 replication-associated recombination protein A [Immundisolibacter sp.]
MADDLFDSTPAAGRPLADRLRPRTLDEVLGQPHLLGPGKPLRVAIEADLPRSMIFWGPPGTGKTTLARVLAAHTRAEFFTLSAVLAGIKEIREAVERARHAVAAGRRAILFVDEVHRWNRAQQDALLPHVEDGTVTLIGATTENPSFELNNALLSRARVYVLRPLTEADLLALIERALTDTERGLGALHLSFPTELRPTLAAMADGDARRLLGLLELAADIAPDGVIDEAVLKELAGESWRRFDKGGEAFYDQISALHKAVRGSSPDAALYWLARMLDGGCEPLYIARRVLRMASEDVGLADPRALALALDACDTYERLGSPEGELAIAQAVTYLACAPKSNAVYTAFDAAMADARRFGSLPPPLRIRNAPTRLMKQLGYGKGYRYAHDEAGAYAAGERYFPDEMPDRRYYQPSGRGLERRLAEHLAELRARDREAGEQ